MKLHVFILLIFLCLAVTDAQRTRTQNNAETELPTQQRKARGRVRFALPIDVDAELADIPSKSIRPEGRIEPRSESRLESRVEPKPTPVVRKLKLTTPKTTPYEVEEVVDDIPDSNFRKVHKARVITETRFEAASAPKKTFFEPFPRPENKVSTEELFASFTTQITKSTTEKLVDKKKEPAEETVEKKEVKKPKNNVKEETVTEEKISLDEEAITLSKEIEEDVSASSSLHPESTTSSDVSSTENEIKKDGKAHQTSNNARKLRTSRIRPQTPEATTSSEEATNKVRSRGRARPALPSTEAPQATPSENTRFQRTRSRSRPTTSESAEIPSRGKATSSESAEIPLKITRVRSSRRRTNTSEENSSAASRTRGLSVFGENSHEGPVRSRTGRKVNYPAADNIPLDSENNVFTVKPRRGHNLVKTEETQRVAPRGRTSRGQQRSIDVTETPKANSRRNPSRRRIETNQVLPSRKTELAKPEEKRIEESTTSSTTSTAIASTTTADRSSKRNGSSQKNSQRSPSRSEVTSTTPAPRNSRGRIFKKVKSDPPIEKKVEPLLSSSFERKSAFKSRQRSRFLPPIIDEQKLEVLPLFESEAKTVEPIIRRGPRENEAISKSSNEIITVVKPITKEKIEVHTQRPIIKSTVETKISEVVSTRRVVRPIIRKRKKSKDNKSNSDSKKAAARGQKKAELAKALNSSDEGIEESDNYPEPFKALIQAKVKEDKQSSRTRSSEEPSAKRPASAEKVVTVQRFTSSTSSTSTTKAPVSEVVRSTPKKTEDDNNIAPSSTAPTTRGTRRKFSLATKPPDFENTPQSTSSKQSKRPNSNGRKTKPARSTVAPSQVSIATEISQAVKPQPRYHARFVASTTTEGSLNLTKDDQSASSTTPRAKLSAKTPRGLYSSRKGSGKKKGRKIDAANNQQVPTGGKKKNRYSARYRSDIVSRPGSTRPTSAPAYIPTVPTVTPSYVKQRIEDGMEIISIDEPVANTIPSDNLINGELLTPSNIPEKLLPASLVTTGVPAAQQPSEKQPVSIIERIIYSITAISSTVAPNKTSDETVDRPTKETAIFKIPSKKEQTKQTTDQTNEILTATTEKPTTIIERILSSINAIQSTASPTATNNLPGTPLGVEASTNQAIIPIEMTNETLTNVTTGEFDDIPQINVTENATNDAQNETVSNSGRDTEEVNIEENTISNNGNTKPEKIIQVSAIVETTTMSRNDVSTVPEIQNVERTTLPSQRKLEVITVPLKQTNVVTTTPTPQRSNIVTILPKQVVQVVLPARNNELTTTPSKNDQTLPKTVIPELNLIENAIRETTTQGGQMTTQRYTNTPTTVPPIFEDYQLNIRSTTPYFIQRVLGNFIAVGSRIGIPETTTATEQTTESFTQNVAGQRVTTTLETTTPRAAMTTQPPTATASATTARATTTQSRPTQPPTTQSPTTQPPTTQPLTTQLPTTQPTTTQPPTTQPSTTQPPTTQPPTTQPPTTQPPTTQPPTTQPPTTQPPTTQSPTTTRASTTTQATTITTRATTTRVTTTELRTTTKPSTTIKPRRITTTHFPETTFWTTTRRPRTITPTATERFTTIPRRITRPTTRIDTEPPTTTIRQPITTVRRRSGRLRNTTPIELIRTVTVTPSTQTTDPSQTEQPTFPPTTITLRKPTTTTTTRRPTTMTTTSRPTTTTSRRPATTTISRWSTFSPNTIPTETVNYEPQTIFPIYTTPPYEQTTRFTVTTRPITKTPTTTSPTTLSGIEELRRLAELRVLENFGELSTTNDFVSTTTSNPTTLQSTLKGVNAKVKVLTEQQKKDLQELARLEKEQGEILKQLAFLTRLNLATPQKPTRSPSSLASRVLEFAAERDKKTTTENPIDLLSTLTNAGEPKKIAPGTKDVTLDELLRQFSVNPEKVTPSNLVSTYGESTDAILAALLKEQGIGPSTPKTLGEQLKTTIPVGIPTERTTQRITTTTRKRITTTTTRRPGPIMQGLNWLLNMLGPSPTTTKRPAKKRVTTTERISTISGDIDVFSSQPTEISPLVVAAPKRSTPNPNIRAGRKYKRPLHALSEDELTSLITQLEEAQKDPKKAENLDLSGYDLSRTTHKTSTFVNDNAVQITNSGKVGTTSKLQAASSDEKEVVYKRKPTTPIPSTVSNSISEEEENKESLTKPPRRPTLRPVVLNPIPGIDNGEDETRVRGQLLSAAVNVTRAISQFLGSAIQRAGQSFQSLLGSGSKQVGNLFTSSNSANG